MIAGLFVGVWRGEEQKSDTSHASGGDDRNVPKGENYTRKGHVGQWAK